MYDYTYGRFSTNWNSSVTDPKVDNQKLYPVITNQLLKNPEYFKGKDTFDTGVYAQISTPATYDRETESVSDPLSFSLKVETKGLPHPVIESPLMDLKIMKRIDPKWFGNIPEDSPVTRIDFYHQKKGSTEPDLRNPYTYNGFIKLFPKDPVVLIIKFRDREDGPSTPIGVEAGDREVVHVLDNIKKVLRQRN